MNHHDEDSDLVGAYVLDALAPDERDAFEAHLEACVDCRHEVLELRRVVDVLPLACEPVEPPDTLRERIMSEVQPEATERPPLRPIAGGLAEPSVRRRRFPASTLFAAVAAVLILGLGLWNVKLQHDIDAKQHSIALYQSQLSLQQAVEQARSAGAIVSLMPSQQTASAPAAAMVQPPNGGRASFIVRGLPSTPANKVYQLWLIRGGVPRSAGVFTYQGIEPRTVRLALAASGYSLAAVTVERSPRGSRAPTSKPILSGKLVA